MRRIKGWSLDAAREALITAMLRVKLVHQKDGRDENALSTSLNHTAGPAVNEIRDGAHLDDFTGTLEHIHEARSIQSRFYRILPLTRKIESPFINRELNTTQPKLAQQLLHLCVKTLEEQRARHQIQGIVAQLATSVIVMDREVMDVTPGFSQHGPIPVHVVVADSNQLDRRIDGAHRVGIAVVVTRVRFSI